MPWSIQTPLKNCRPRLPTIACTFTFVSCYWLSPKHFSKSYCKLTKYLKCTWNFFLDIETMSVVFLLVDVYIALTQCLRYLCDQIYLYPRRSFSITSYSMEASQRLQHSCKSSDVFSKGCKDLVGIWRLRLPSGLLAHFSWSRHSLRLLTIIRYRVSF